MKTLWVALICFLPLTAFAGMIKTSSQMINPEFSLTDAHIRAIDAKTVAALQSDDEKAADALKGRLLSYKCQESDAYATSYFLKCVFIHDLPRGWDWYGFYEVTYKKFGQGDKAVVKSNYKWVASEFGNPNTNQTVKP